MKRHAKQEGVCSVLFVCLGNICRSPAAEGVMLNALRQMRLEQHFRIDSAGTSSYHIGEPADRRMRQAASRRGIELTSRSRMVAPRDFRDFDLIVAMDRENLSELIRVSGRTANPNLADKLSSPEQPSQPEQLKLLSEFLDDSWPVDVPDPYFGGEDGFETVLDMLQAACPVLIAEIRGEAKK